MVDSARPGLRERKKQLTRESILAAAEEMFAERGFDDVTVAEIAERVNVAAKTVFVYFPAKDDLVFHDEDAVRDSILARVRDRAEGETPFDAMAALLRELVASAGAGSVSGLDRLRRTVGDSAVLKARMRLMWEKFEVALAELLAADAGADAHAPEPRVVAAQLISIFRLLASEETLGYVRSRPRSKQRAAMANWLEISLDLAGRGVAAYAP
jgi:AcrR family transcriptional regulator